MAQLGDCYQVSFQGHCNAVPVLVLNIRHWRARSIVNDISVVGFSTIIVGIFLLRAFKDIDFTFDNFPSFSKNQRSAGEVTARYTSLKETDHPEENLGFPLSDDEDNTVLFAKTMPPAPNGSIVSR